MGQTHCDATHLIFFTADKIDGAALCIRWMTMTELQLL